MPVPYLPVELIKLIVADPTLEKGDLQSLNLTARAFPPLVRPNLFRVLEIPLGWIAVDPEHEVTVDQRRAITLAEMERLMAFRLHPDLAALVKKVSIQHRYKNPELEPPPGSIRMTASDFMQLVYSVLPCLEEAILFLAEPPIAPPRLQLPCCQTLHTLRGVLLDTQTWNNLQTCTALRVLDIGGIMFEPDQVPAVPPLLSLRLETLHIGLIFEDNMSDLFLKPFLRACGPTLKHLWLGLEYDEVPDLSMLPRLVSLGFEMRADDWNGDLSESLEAWLGTALPTCTALERLTIKATEDGATLRKTPQGLLAVPKVAAALPTTLKRIDFDMLPKEGELEAALSNNKSVQVIGMPRQTGDYPWLDVCRQRGVKVVGTEMNEWPA